MGLPIAEKFTISKGTEFRTIQVRAAAKRRFDVSYPAERAASAADIVMNESAP